MDESSFVKESEKIQPVRPVSSTTKTGRSREEETSITSFFWDFVTEDSDKTLARPVVVVVVVVVGGGGGGSGMDVGCRTT